ncbi:hypothetical protein E2562_021660 [Oryza meyeriana var. granulata]|uniref:Uncharacterized protein n=1 Tax=Oryza meyeriana var. granulata TaxID=110450 RepID=A0A6G1E0N1_9ORYZ|nr:hypothetical protein E2562_021660 [Oryza meyeriana var. granulata]
MPWLHCSDHRRSWTARLLSSASLPPARLLVFFAIVIFFLSVSTYVDYKAIERRAEIGVRVFAAPLAAVTVFVLFLILQHRRRYWTLRQHYTPAVHQPTSSVHSIWFRPLWDSDYY